MRRALITGITGQDGGYLAEFLLEKSYEVVGTVRSLDSGNPSEIEHLRDRVRLVEVDLTDEASVERAVRETLPHEIYNLAAQSSVPVSWQRPVATGDVTALGPVRLLSAIVEHVPDARFFQAGSSELFGRTTSSPQTEATPFCPSSPYGIAKLYAHLMTATFRQRFGIFATSGILYNHESPRRAPCFVTRKITQAAAKIALGIESELRLGNLDAPRDWGSAQDFVRGMWLALQADEPDDFIFGTGEARTVRDFVRAAFEAVGLDWKSHVVVDPQFLRPVEPVALVADASKARSVLRWKPEIEFRDMVRSMVEHDLALLRQDRSRPSRRAA